MSDDDPDRETDPLDREDDPFELEDEDEVPQPPEGGEADAETVEEAPVDLGIDESEEDEGERESGSDREDAFQEVGSPDSPAVVDPFETLESEAEGAAEGVSEDAFERMEVGDLGEEDVWEALAEGEPAIEGEATPVEDAAGGEEYLLDKREYCQRCPHFSEPPEVECRHEEGRILEVVEGDEFRVRGCPMVTEEGPRFDRTG